MTLAGDCQAVSGRMLNQAQTTARSHSQGHHTQAYCVKTGQLSRLFRRYNKRISEQRNLVNQFESRPFSSAVTKAEAPYQLDKAYIAQQQKLCKSLARAKRRKSKRMANSQRRRQGSATSERGAAAHRLVAKIRSDDFACTSADRAGVPAALLPLEKVENCGGAKDDASDSVYRDVTHHSSPSRSAENAFEQL